MTASASGQGERGSELPGSAMSDETEQFPSTKLRRRPSIVVILLVIAVTVVVIVATLAWYLIQLSPQVECTCPGDPCVPVAFAPPSKSGTPPGNHTASWAVVHMECPFITSFASFEASIYMNGTPLGALRTIVANTTISFGTDAKLIVTDTDGNGKLTLGDRFLVYGMSEPRIWRFFLIWAVDTSELQEISWSTP